MAIRHTGPSRSAKPTPSCRGTPYPCPNAGSDTPNHQTYARRGPAAASVRASGTCRHCRDDGGSERLAQLDEDLVDQVVAAATRPSLDAELITRIQDEPV